VKRAETLAELQLDPLGKYFVGRTWLSFFAAHGRFSGTVVWGIPTADDVHAWESCADLRLSPACAPHATLFEGHQIERLTGSAYDALSRYAAKRMDRLKERITRLAVVHWGGFAGAVAMGFTKLVPIPFPTELFGDTEAALAWLGCAEDLPSLALLSRVELNAKSASPLVQRLTSILVHNPRATPLEAARALALSTRSLQRKLAEQNTSFRQELDAARLRLAKRLLLESEASITEIAFQVGLTSPQHLSTLFHKLGHESPRKWRIQGRANGE
jgi:AraC-like DNA-binding protein